MSGKQPRSSQGSFRDNAGEPSRTRTSSSLAGIHGYVLPRARAPPDNEGPRWTHPFQPSSHDVATHEHLPPLSDVMSGLMGEIDSSRPTLAPLREATTMSSVFRSTSASPASADYDERQLHRSTRQHSQEPHSNLRGSTLTTSHSFDFEPRQSYRLAPVHDTGVSNIPRPSSALDSAYLSDLSTISATSSARGAPPPSHASAESTASASSELSRTRVRSWQRMQHQGEGQRLVMRDEPDGVEAGGLYPTYTEVEYERRHGRHGRHAHSPISTMRGGSVGSRGHSYSYGASSALTSVHPWAPEEEGVRYGVPSWGSSEHEGEVEPSASARQRRERFSGGAPGREFAGSEPVSSVTSPIPSERSASAHSHEERSVPQRWGHEPSYAGWSSHRQAIPETAGDPHRLTAVTALYASGSPPGAKDISRSSERNNYYTQPVPNISRGAASSASAQMSGRRSGSPSHASGLVRGSDDLVSPRRLPYTSLPRYSAGPSSAPYSRYVDADEPRYAKEVEPVPHEDRYGAIPSSVSAPLPQRSYTFPATSDERAQSHRVYASVASIRSPAHATLYGPTSNTPPSTLSAGSFAARLPPHAYGGVPRDYHLSGPAQGSAPLSVSPRLSSSASVDEREVVLASPRPSSLLGPMREKKDPSKISRLQPQYAYRQETPQLLPSAPKPSHPLQVSAGSSPRTKRSRSISVERLDAAAGTGSPATVAPIVVTRRGSASRGRGRGRGKRAAMPSPASDSASREASQVPSEPPVFWGRQQRIAHAASRRYQPSTSASILAPAPRRNDEPPIHPDLLRMASDTHHEETAAGPSRASRLAKKGKGKDEEAAATKSVQAGTEVDELQETTDDDRQPQFSVGSNTPSRTGSAGGTRVPRSKIEVACDFCRKRKMKCDGLRPTCKNCQRKGVVCSYIPVVRRRGPGKKQKAVDARPKKTNKRIEADKKQAKGKAKDTAAEAGAMPSQETEVGELTPEGSGSGLRLEGDPHHFPPMFNPGPSGELYLPSPLQHMQSPRPGGRTSTLSGPNISPFPSTGLPLPLYPPEQYPPYGHSPPFGGGNLFLLGHSPTMSSGDIVDPYAGVAVNIPESGRSMLVDVGTHAHVSGSARKASMMSSGPSSSEGELGRHARRRRSSKRAKTDQYEEMGGRELEEGEIDESGPSSGARR